MKTLIAIPCMDQVAAPFCQSLAMLNKVDETMVGMQISSLIYTARNDFAKEAIRRDVDALLFFDSDITFPPDTLERLLQHIKDGKEIVTGIYYKRRPPFTPVLYKHLAYDAETQVGSFEDLLEIPEGPELFEVEGCGMGCCIIAKSVFLDLLLNYQTWFSPLANFGEDLSFCIRAREQGFKIWCDPTIKLGHIGQLIINEEIWKANNEDTKTPAK